MTLKQFRNFFQLFSKFPRLTKLLTVTIFLSLIIPNIEGIQNNFKELTLTLTKSIILPVYSAENSKIPVSSITNNSQQILASYSDTLTDAQKNAENIQQKQSKNQQDKIITGQQIFKKVKGIYQVRGGLTSFPVVSIIIPKTQWDKLSKADKVSLTMYAKSLISVVKSNPAKYVDIPPSAPIYNSVVNKTANMCQDCWSIILSYKNSQPYGIDETVVQGDTPWQQEDPCCRGMKGSEFLKKNSVNAKNSGTLKKQKPKTDSFANAINKAANAAKLTQTAKTLNEWNKVANEWQAAINLMKTVSSKSPNYRVAQQRIVTYSKNLAYAQKNIRNLKKQKSKTN